MNNDIAWRVRSKDPSKHLTPANFVSAIWEEVKWYAESSEYVVTRLVDGGTVKKEFPPFPHNERVDRALVQLDARVNDLIHSRTQSLIGATNEVFIWYGDAITELCEAVAECASTRTSGGRGPRRYA